jgi:hypothetical protein
MILDLERLYQYRVFGSHDVMSDRTLDFKYSGPCPW